MLDSLSFGLKTQRDVERNSSFSPDLLNPRKIIRWVLESNPLLLKIAANQILPVCFCQPRLGQFKVSHRLIDKQSHGRSDLSGLAFSEQEGRYSHAIRWRNAIHPRCGDVMNERFNLFVRGLIVDCKDAIAQSP